MKILQNKVYPLKLKDYDETNYDSNQFSVGKSKMSEIRALLGNSNKSLTTEDVESIISIKDFVPNNIKG